MVLFVLFIPRKSISIVHHQWNIHLGDHYRLHMNLLRPNQMALSGSLSEKLDYR